MTQTDLGSAISALIGFALAVLTIYWPWQHLRIDRARDVLFEKRDALFDIAASGRIDFGSRQYETIRSALNAFVRLAHAITFPRMVFSALFSGPRTGSTLPLALKQVASEISDPATRLEVQKLLQEAEAEIIMLMVWRSPFLLLLALLFRVVGKFGRIRDVLATHFLHDIESEVWREVRA